MMPAGLSQKFQDFITPSLQKGGKQGHASCSATISVQIQSHRLLAKSPRSPGHAQQKAVEGKVGLEGTEAEHEERGRSQGKGKALLQPRPFSFCLWRRVLVIARSVCCAKPFKRVPIVAPGTEIRAPDKSPWTLQWSKVK